MAHESNPILQFILVCTAILLHFIVWFKMFLLTTWEEVSHGMDKMPPPGSHGASSSGSQGPVYDVAAAIPIAVAPLVPAPVAATAAIPPAVAPGAPIWQGGAPMWQSGVPIGNQINAGQQQFNGGWGQQQWRAPKY